jgi:molybdopterin converting factor small subunit
MINVKYVPCLLEDRKIEFQSHNQTVFAVMFSLFKKYPGIRDDPPCITVRVNGKKLHPLEWKKPLNDGDEILIIQEVGGTVISAIIGTLGTTAFMVGTTAITYGTLIQAVFVIASIAYSIYSYCTAPSAPKMGPGLNSSPTYGWEGSRMQCRQGVPVPVVYGEHRRGGNVICHITSESCWRK